MKFCKLLKIKAMDPAWSLHSQMDQNPMAWMVQIHGLLVDARFLKREVQEELVRKGVIPFIPESPTTAAEEEDQDDEME